MADITLEDDLVDLDFINLAQQSTKPATPGTGRATIYVNADGNVTAQTDDGVEHVAGEGATGSITIREADSNPSVTATELVFPNGTLSELSAGVASYSPPVPDPILAMQLDGGPSYTGVSNITLVGGTLTEPESGSVIYSPPPGWPFLPLIAPPAISGLTQVNPTGITFAEGSGAFHIEGPTAAASNSYALVRSATSPFTFTVAVRGNDVHGANTGGGICLRQASSGNMHRGNWIPNNSVCQVDHTTGSVATGTAYTTYPARPYGSLVWWRIVDDGVDRKTYLSFDGLYWLLIHTVAYTTDLTPDQCGVFCCHGSPATPALISCYHWEYIQG